METGAWVPSGPIPAEGRGWEGQGVGAAGLALGAVGHSDHCLHPSGAEDRHGYIWDRHYNICLAKLQHDNVVNSVAFSPVEQELLLTASDDTTIKVWRSPRAVRIRQARRPRPRKLLFSWLMNQKS